MIALNAIQESEKRSLVAELKPYKYGLFITIHSVYSDNTNAVRITTNTIERFKSHLDELRSALGRYCFGREFNRKNKEQRVFGAIEVGACGRLHAHLTIVSKNQCTRSLDAIRQRLEKKMRPHASSIATGENALDIQWYERSKLASLVPYYFKQRLYIRDRFGIDGLI